MADAFSELNARVAEIRTNLEFVALATRLRPRIGEAVRWDSGRDLVHLMQDFMNAKSIRA